MCLRRQVCIEPILDTSFRDVRCVILRWIMLPSPRANVAALVRVAVEGALGGGVKSEC